MMEKFSIAQMTSNADGKTSGSGFIGVYAGFVGVTCFLIGAISYTFSDKPDQMVMMNSTGLIAIAVTLLGYRKNQSTKEIIAKQENTSNESTGN